jgi:hypothetical protein
VSYGRFKKVKPLKHVTNAIELRVYGHLYNFERENILTACVHHDKIYLLSTKMDLIIFDPHIEGKCHYSLNLIC